MRKNPRDLIAYTEQYKSLPFEPIQAGYRRQLVLTQVNKVRPRSILEVGCGDRPLFTDLPHDLEITVVEPSPAFAANARSLAHGRSGLRIVQGYVETVDLTSCEFDCIVLSCVLHEVPDPKAFLRSVHRLSNKKTTVHINVPNANSLHRMLAVAMGLSGEPGKRSDMQRLMQQRDSVYDVRSLRSELEDSGFRVLEEGSLFIKPFTHSQMQALVDSGFLSTQILDGLDRLVNWLPEFGSEIWVNASRVE